MKIIKYLISGLILGIWMVSAAAELPAPNDQVSFQVEVDQEIDNDRVNVVMKAYDENTDPAALAEQINKTMTWGLAAAKKVAGIKVRTGGYQTYPAYSDKNKIKRWRGQQELLLEAREAGKLSKLLGALQSRLQMQSMQFSVSPQARRSAQDSLIEQALQAFQKRAELVSKSLAAAGYEIMTVSVQTGGHTFPVPVRMESVRSMAKASVRSPAVEAGTSRVRVQVSGTIHLLR